MKRKIIIKIIDKIKLLFKIIMLKKTKKVIFDKGSMTDLSSYFEGRNRLAKNAVLLNSHISFASYLGENTYLNNVNIGKYTCIGPRVNILIGQHPTDSFVSVHPAFFSIRKQIGFTYVDKNLFNEFKYVDDTNKISIEIGNDVWIASDVKLLEGIKIGDGAIVAAGSVVTKNIPPYSICGGVPAKIIRYRFDDNDIRFLLEIKWWEKSEEWIKEYVNYFDDIKKFRFVVSK